MLNIYLEPIDVCGCGDEGYLTSRTLPVDLINGVGKIHHVPVYHCRSESCPEYSVPIPVSHRLDEMAEQMEKELILETEFSWPESKLQADEKSRSLKSLEKNSLIQAFTLKFLNREYEDAKVVYVVPGQAIFLQSKLDQSEYYLLRYEASAANKGTWFSFSKFYPDDSSPDYSEILQDEPSTFIKELAVLSIDEIEDSLSDEFGEIV